MSGDVSAERAEIVEGVGFDAAGLETAAQIGGATTVGVDYRHVRAALVGREYRGGGVRARVVRS